MNKLEELEYNKQVVEKLLLVVSKEVTWYITNQTSFGENNEYRLGMITGISYIQLLFSKRLENLEKQIRELQTEETIQEDAPEL